MGKGKGSLLVPTPPPAYGYAPAPDFDKEIAKQLKDMPVEIADTHVHPSSFNHWCRRREVFRVLKQALNVAVPRSTAAPAARKLMEIGTAVHEHYRNTVLSGMMRGTWKCMTCGHIHGNRGDLLPCPTECANCGQVKYHQLDPAFSYQEISFIDNKLMLAGSTDGVVEYAGKLRVGEFKTEKSERWDKRVKPSAGHVLQAVIYGALLNREFKLGITTALIVYINKQDGSMRKSYLVKVDPAAFKWACEEARIVGVLGKKYAQRVKMKGDLYKIALDEEFTAENPLRCKKPTEFTAKSCASCKECFSGKDSKTGLTK